MSLQKLREVRAFSANQYILLEPYFNGVINTRRHHTTCGSIWCLGNTTWLSINAGFLHFCLSNIKNCFFHCMCWHQTWFAPCSCPWGAEVCGTGPGGCPGTWGVSSPELLQARCGWSRQPGCLLSLIIMTARLARGEENIKTLIKPSRLTPPLGSDHSHALPLIIIYIFV